MFIKILISISILTSIIVFFSSCDKFNPNLEYNPTDELSSGNIYSSPSSIKAALNGVYYLMYEPGDHVCSLYQMAIPFVNEVRADDIISVEDPWWRLFDNVYSYNTDMSDNLAWYIWSSSYEVIDACNNLINNGLEALPNDIIRKDYIAQAKAIRGMVYMDLTNVFCKPYHINNGENPGVPLMLSGDHATYQSRGRLKQVYEQIHKDFSEALPDLTSENEPTRINKMFVNGLLARYYLNIRKYDIALVHASTVVDNIPLMSRDDFRKGLAGNPSEALFTFTNTKASYDVYRTFQTYWEGDESMGKDIRVPVEMVENFSDDDIRKTFFWNRFNWSGENDDFTGKTAIESACFDIGARQISDRYYMYGKFVRADFECSDLESYLAPYEEWNKVDVEKRQSNYITDAGSLGFGNYTFMRASEMVLVKAECLCRIATPKYGEAQDELYKIQSRAILDTDKSVRTGEDLIAEIMLEKRKELLGEGVRMRDALRLGEKIIRPESGWALKNEIDIDTEPRIILPIPNGEIKSNPLISNGDQNEGY